MIPRVAFQEISFGQPAYLWLLVLPLAALAVWVWRLWARRHDARRLRRNRTLPVRERYAVAGDLPFWLCLIAATACLVVALARPQGPALAVRQAGVDLVILQDASASMRVKDVPGDRWQRAMRFHRALGDALSWRNDRLALAVFARIAAPQIRLTKDPNTFFFFLDHLDSQPPFRLEDESTWDTNLELGIHWGLRLMERDEEVHGPSLNAKVFVVVSDGEIWSGEVETSLAKANERRVPVEVVGVGTLGGGRLPVVKSTTGEDMLDPDAPLVSRLDRAGLQRVASTGHGQYYELDRENDREIANAIVDRAKRRAPTIGLTEEAEDLYWRLLWIGAGFVAVGLLFLRERTDVWIQAIGAVAAFGLVMRLLS